MHSGILQAAGGLGLFLLGMSVMTDGLRALSDDRLRRIIARSTKSPLSGACTGAVTTAILQSSSATIVAAVGFVHSGLLTFSASLGIIFGANIGTTMTGWLVALLGFKLQLGEIVLPVILVGALMRLTGKGNVRWVGTALAGFGLIFVGISSLQSGMASFQGLVTPESFPADTLVGRLLLILIGVAITLITQSSSAGVAAALVAVSSGAISLNQAAAMVIGMNFGTTATAAIATIGGNIQAKRTGFAHVIFNGLTAIGALALLTPYFVVLGRLFPNIKTNDPEIALVSFHTFFNALGVIVILPFTNSFARLIERIFPERGNPLAKRLDAGLLTSPDVALSAVLTTLQEITQSIFQLIGNTLSQLAVDRDDLAEIEDAAQRTRDYLEKIRSDPQRPEQVARHANAVHILDHVRRVGRRALDEKRLALARADEDVSAMTDKLTDSIDLLGAIEFPTADEVRSSVQKVNHELKASMRSYRIRLLRKTAAGELTTNTALQRMDAARVLRRLGYHAWRIADHASIHPLDRT